MVAVAANAQAEADTAQKAWKGDVEFGYTEISGNSESTTIKGHINAARTFGKWKNTTIFDALNASDDGDRSAEKYFLSDKLDRALSDHDYLFAFASYEDDRYSGFDYQATIAAGYGFKILNRDTMQWDAEVGPGYRYSKYDEVNADGDDDESEVILRLATKYNWQFSDTAEFEQVVSVEAGEENTVSKSSTSLKTTIIGQFSLKLAYIVKYTEEVPADKKHADTETVVTVGYSF